jgi:cytochrome c
VILLFLISVYVHPFGTVKHQRSARPLLSGVSIDPKARNIVSRSCQNCHSEATEWPWYSYIAPVSWLVESDVSRARSHLDFARWEGYSSDQRFTFLSEISMMVSAGTMPPSRYLLMHPEATLSDADIAEIAQWVRIETKSLRSTLRSAPAPHR